MITEKTARKREAAVLEATKPLFHKIGQGLDVLIKSSEKQAQKNEERLKAITERIGIEEEIRISEQKAQYQREKDINRKIDNLEKQSKKQNEGIYDFMRINCEHCGAFISPVQIVCHKCGFVSNIFPYNVDDFENVVNICTHGISLLSDTIKSIKQISVSYEEVQKEIEAMYKIKAIAKAYQNLETSQHVKRCFASIQEETEGFISRNIDRHIEIAVVGNVKSGKSTLINALLGARMASANATPETSVLVKYRTTTDKNYIRVSFYNQKEWDEKIWTSVKDDPVFMAKYKKLDAQTAKKKYVGHEDIYAEYETIDLLKSNIMKWTSSSNPEYFFASEVEVGFCGDQFPHDVVLVDTPGLSDIVKYRSKITRKYLEKANWVLACVRYETISSETEYMFLNEVISSLQHNSKRMIIVATQADKENSLSDIDKKQNEFFKYITKFYGGKLGIAMDHFISIYAEPHLLLDEYLLGKLEPFSDSETLLFTALRKLRYRENEIADKKEEIKDRFGITVLRERLNEKVYKNRRKQIIAMIKEDYKKVNENIRSYAMESFSDARDDLLSISTESDAFNDRLQILDESIKEINEQKEAIQKMVSTIHSSMKA